MLHPRCAAFKTIQTTGTDEGSASGEKPVTYRHSAKVVYSYVTDKHRFTPRFHRGKILHRIRYHRRPMRLGSLYSHNRRSRFRLPSQFRQYIPSSVPRHHRYFIRRIRPMIFVPNFRPRQPTVTRPWVMYPEGQMPEISPPQLYGDVPDLFEGKTKYFRTFANINLNAQI